MTSCERGWPRCPGVSAPRAALRFRPRIYEATPLSAREIDKHTPDFQSHTPRLNQGVRQTLPVAGVVQLDLVVNEVPLEALEDDFVVLPGRQEPSRPLDDLVRLGEP